MATLSFEEAALPTQERSEVDRVREVVAEVHAFVRSRELNRTVSSFTLDHYIEQRKARIRGNARSTRTASGQPLDLRASQLEQLDTLEESFRAVYRVAEELARAAEDDREESS